ncbi:hypothetical protein HK101_002011, partial [Irineochytrium annulatum]
VTIADTTRAHRILETSHPPTYYLPLEDVRADYLRETPRSTCCEWKGVCSYYALVPDPVGKPQEVVPDRAWVYRSPNARFTAIKNAVAFYAKAPVRCFVDDEEVVPQPGNFYGGWMTSDIDGGKKGVKGGPGTWGW